MCNTPPRSASWRMRGGVFICRFNSYNFPAMSSRTLFRIVQGLLYLLIAGTPLFYLSRTVYPYGLSKTFFFQAVVELLFVAWVLLAWREPRFRPRSTPLIIALSLFAGILLLTVFTGVDPWRSFWSTQERAVGVFTLLHIIALVFVLRSVVRELRVERLLYVSLGASLLVSLLGFLQLFVPRLLLPNEGIQFRPGSTFGNPSFLAGYLIFSIFLAGYLWYRRYRLRMERRGTTSSFAAWFLSVCFLADGIVLFLTGTRGALLGAAAGAFLFLGLLAWSTSQQTRRVVLVVLGSFVLFGLFFWGTRGNLLWKEVPGLGRFQGLSLQSDALAPRLIALEAGWKGFKERPLVGWGWENFNVIFNKFYDPRALEANYQETRFDKPHNFILEYMDAGGLPLVLAYIAVFAAFYWEASRIRDRLWGNLAIAAAGAYVVQNLFLFETIGPLLLWAVYMGLVDAAYAEEKEGKVSGSKSVLPSSRVSLGAALAAFLPAAFFVYFINIQSVIASSYQFWGFNYFLNNRPEEAIKSFMQGISLWGPYRWNMERDYAIAVAQAYFYNPDKVSAEEAKQAVRAMEASVRAHPLDAYGHYALVDIYNQVSNIDPSRYLPAAEKEAATALVLSPNRQEVYFSLAKTKSLEGDNPAALKLLQKALALDPQVPDAHFYYGLIAYALGDNDTGYRELQKSLALGRSWKNYNEARVAGNFFADSGYLEEAITAYSAALALNPFDLEARTKLGVAKYIKGDMAGARENLLEVSRYFDFRTSPSFASLKPILNALGIEK